MSNIIISLVKPKAVSNTTYTLTDVLSCEQLIRGGYAGARIVYHTLPIGTLVRVTWTPLNVQVLGFAIGKVSKKNGRIYWGGFYRVRPERFWDATKEN